MGRCKRCKTLTERYASGACIVCVKAASTRRRLANPEATKAAVKAYHEANRDSQIAYLKDYYRSHKEQSKGYVRARKANRSVPSDSPKAKRNYRFKRLYGLTSKDVEDMLLAQGNKCKICQRADVRRWNVDHSHTTGQVRGILCTPCNMGIGQLGDDPERLEAAAKYLRDTKR